VEEVNALANHIIVTLSKTVFIDRANRASSRATFDTASHTMTSESQNVFIFPEGTRSYAEEPKLLPFKKGAFHLAVQAQVPIVPVVCANYSHILNLKEKRFKPGVIDVTILPPIRTKGCTADDVNRLAEKAEKAMLEELCRLSHVTEGGKNAVPLPGPRGLDPAVRELRKRH
jgi:lysophosphatidate acyltransferase